MKIYWKATKKKLRTFFKMFKINICVMTAQAFGIETSDHFESSLKSNISLLGI